MQANLSTVSAGKNVVITGCAGLIGSHFAHHMLSQGYVVHGVDNLSGGYADWLPNHPDFFFHELDLTHNDAGNQIASLQPLAIFHFAAYAAEGLSPFIRKFNYEQNLVASASAINAAIAVGAKLIFSSSMAVYGNQQTPFEETMARLPVDPYGVAKTAVEMDLEVAAAQHSLRYSIVRPHNVIGTQQNIWDRYRNVIGIFIRRGLDGQPLQVYGDGSQTRAFSDVRHYMPIFESLIVQGDGEIFNLGSDSPTTVLEAAMLVQTALEKRGLPVEIDHVEPRHEVKEAHCSHEKAKAMLGFKDTTRLAETIDDMVEWAISQPPRAIKTVDYEISKGIYSYWQ